MSGQLISSNGVHHFVGEYDWEKVNASYLQFGSGSHMTFLSAVSSGVLWIQARDLHLTVNHWENQGGLSYPLRL